MRGFSRLAAPITASANDVGEVARVIELRPRGSHNLCKVWCSTRQPKSRFKLLAYGLKYRLFGEECAADDVEVITCQLYKCARRNLRDVCETPFASMRKNDTTYSARITQRTNSPRLRQME